MFFPLTLLVTLLFLHTHCTQCIYGENYWHSKPEKEWPLPVRTNSLCNQSWFSAFQQKNGSLWNTTFREICVASLNNFAGDEVAEIWKGMEVGCSDRVRWADMWEIILPRLLGPIRAYNRGVGKLPLCPLTLSPSFSEVDALKEAFDTLNFYIRIISLWCLVLTAALVILIKKTNRLFY